MENNRRKFLHLPCRKVTYGPFVKDMAKEANRIFSFLTLKRVDNLPVPLNNINPDSVKDLIENYDEVKESLLGTEFEFILDESRADT